MYLVIRVIIGWKQSRLTSRVDDRARKIKSEPFQLDEEAGPSMEALLCVIDVVFEWRYIDLNGCWHKAL